MCGVAGYITYKKQNINIENMLQLLKHRGPDKQKSKLFNLENSIQVCLGHTRLSIQDLSSKANQPMSDISKKYHIVYNGEVYNFNEIKKELLELNYSFQTSSDTEVILYSYIQWGIEAVNKFIGMFTIVILDLNLTKLIFFNDRLGVKPLYIYQENDILIFASEIKSILEYQNITKKINIIAFTQFMKYGYIQPPLSIFENITKIEPGNAYEFNIYNQEKSTYKYWDVMDFVTNKQHLEIDALQNIIKKAISYRTVSDVPLSSFLSSGIDSSLVCSILKEEGYNIDTITIGVNNHKYNEAILSKEIANALGTNHNEYYIDDSDIINLVEKMPFYFDEPFADSSMYPTYMINNITSKKYKVALSADGGDESFGGYSRYLFLKKYYFLSRFPTAVKFVLLMVVNFLEKIKILTLFNIVSIPLKLAKIKNVLKSNNIADFYESLNTYIGNDSIKRICKNYSFDNGYFKLFNQLDNNDTLNNAMSIDYKTYLYQVLTKIDRTSMANSIEVREPLLDHNIIEYAISIASSEKIANNQTKKPLRDILNKYLNLNLLTKQKKGFSVPIEDWLKVDLKPLIERYVNKDSIELSDLFKWDEVNKIKKKFYNGSNDYIALWHIFIFQMWYDKWVKKIVHNDLI